MFIEMLARGAKSGRGKKGCNLYFLSSGEGVEFEKCALDTE
jgi:hypothetical protein